ncbi:zinc finger protein 708-like [Teleopsis dalmanni]|uniref:zinc finger protein 708-like n=1 Tax=Teleopsis dalmanni TaxID=139649 RepID=UPI0018CE125F|nr:zinc finger protein 708-like [Teleopsis dalmanni]
MLKYEQNCRICLTHREDLCSLYTKVPHFKQPKCLTKIIEEISGASIVEKFEPNAKICTGCYKAIIDAANIIMKCKNSCKNADEFNTIKVELLENNIEETVLSNHKRVEYTSEKNVTNLNSDIYSEAPINNTCSFDPSNKKTNRRKYIRRVNANKEFYFRCTHCSYFTCFATYYRKHLEEIHKIMNARIFKCTQCEDKDFLEHRYLQEHIELKHKQLPKYLNFLCSECGAGFNKSSTLRYHQRTHLPKASRKAIQSVRCEFCNKNFSKNSIRMHKKVVHAAQRPHACKICQVDFALYSSLQSHMRNSHSTLKYSCPCCESKFRIKSVYDAHLKRGTCKKLGFNCSYCAWRFRTAERLRKHEINVHKNLLYADKDFNNDNNTHSKVCKTDDHGKT